MTNEELQTVVSAVLSALQTNGKTVEQLTAVTGVSSTDYFELNDGRKVDAESLATSIATIAGLMTNATFQNTMEYYITAEQIAVYFAALNLDNNALDWKQSPIVALESMGSDLDNIDGGSWTYTPSEGDLYYAGGTYIREKTEGGWEGFDAKEGVLYYNKHTGVFYRYYNANMLMVGHKVVNDLTTGGTLNALSAEQGKLLKALIDAIDTTGGGGFSYDVNDTTLRMYATSGGSTAEQTATPTISVSSLSNGGKRISISAETGATIYYTTDGTTPNTSSSVYSGAFTIETAGDHTIKAKAIVSGKTMSAAATSTFTIAGTAAPTLAMTYDDSDATITATCSDSTATVYLTVGSDTASGTGSASVVVERQSTAQSVEASAYAQASGELPSTTVTETFTVPATSSGGETTYGSNVLAGTANVESLTLNVNGTSYNVTGVWNSTTQVYDWQVEIAETGVVQYGTTTANMNYNIMGNQNDTKLLSITHMPDEWTALNGRYFAYCQNLASICIGKNIGAASVYNQVGFVYAFTQSAVTQYTVESGSTYFKSTNGVLYSYDGATLAAYPYARTDASFEFPNTITTIKAYAFSGATYLTSLNLPSGLTTIEQNAFYGITGVIGTIDMPTGISSIKASAFAGATNCSVKFYGTAPTLANANALNDLIKVYYPSAYASAYASGTWANVTNKESY